MLDTHIETERLILRTFAPGDAAAVQSLAGHWEVYKNTRTIPHPYEDGMAEAWIAAHPEQLKQGTTIPLAITLKSSGELMGAISLKISKEDFRGELGYWLGMPFWGKGYCTEAARAMVNFGFQSLNLHKITAKHIESNPASGRVMIKLGMKLEGILLDEEYKVDQFHNLLVYGVINPDPANSTGGKP